MPQVVSFLPLPPSDLVKITHPDRSNLLREISEYFVDRRGFTLATLNLDHVVKLRGDPKFRAAYLDHSHVVADGNPIVWLSRIARRQVDLIPGSELIHPLCEIAAEHDVPVGLLGATKDTLARAAAELEASHPGLRVVAQIAPPFGFDVNGHNATDFIDDLRASGARLCFLALGAPKQEILAVRSAHRIPYCGFVSIGAGLDFIVGSQARAPRWVRRIAMEWLWRMAGDPLRLTRRYAACFFVLPGLLCQALRERRE